VAEAEAIVHGVSVEEVAFHEVGALDSIIDIVGAAICLDFLNPDRITASAIELGGGTVRCAHGVLPVPAPATLKICEGLPVRTGGYNKEMTTPTGAAILAACVDEFVDFADFADFAEPAAFVELKTGYGLGTRKMDRPNALRASLREPFAPPPQVPLQTSDVYWHTEALTLIETNIDDMSGEALGFLMSCLFEAGALDVTLTPCTMKKSRPGVIVSCLCPPAKLDALRRTMFEKSAAIGFRETAVSRQSLRREISALRGTFGKAGVKTVYMGGKTRAKVEAADKERIARENGLSFDEAAALLVSECGGGSAE
jgi:uncharacterized protein (TIGR00299 family) protein